MPRGQDTGRHPNRQVSRARLTPPPGHDDYSNTETDQESEKMAYKASNKHQGPLPIHKARGGA